MSRLSMGYFFFFCKRGDTLLCSSPYPVLQLLRVHPVAGGFGNKKESLKTYLPFLQI